MKYTERIDGFQICDPSYWPGMEPKTILPIFDIVKWEQHDPIEVIDMKTGEKKMSTENCYVVARLVWDSNEPWFDFKSIGTRWLECKPTEAVIDMIMDFANKKASELGDINEEIKKNQSWEDYADYSVCPFCRKPTIGNYKFCPNCSRRVYSRY